MKPAAVEESVMEEIGDVKDVAVKDIKISPSKRRKFVVRLYELPIVNSLCERVSGVYGQTRERNVVVHFGIAAAEVTFKTALVTTQMVYSSLPSTGLVGDIKDSFEEKGKLVLLPSNSVKLKTYIQKVTTEKYCNPPKQNLMLQIVFLSASVYGVRNDIRSGKLNWPQTPSQRPLICQVFRVHESRVYGVLISLNFFYSLTKAFIYSLIYSFISFFHSPEAHH